MTDETHDWDGCLMCAVRALTEGRPQDWALRKDPAEGDTVTGVVLRMGTQPTYYTDAQAPYVDLWLGGVERVRVAGHGTMLREALISAEIQVGDTVTVTFEGVKPIPAKGRQPERSFKKFTVTVERGHH